MAETIKSTIDSFMTEQASENTAIQEEQKVIISEMEKKEKSELAGTPVEIIMPVLSLQDKIIGEINKFTPARKYLTEDNYRSELFGFLKQIFPTAQIEVQVDSSRPDIAIDEVAIEIKGPTDSNGLNTLADKAMRYRKTWKHIIMVLFDIQVTDFRYDEWYVPFKQYYGDVVVIKK